MWIPSGESASPSETIVILHPKGSIGRLTAVLSRDGAVRPWSSFLARKGIGSQVPPALGFGVGFGGRLSCRATSDGPGSEFISSSRRNLTPPLLEFELWESTWLTPGGPSRVDCWPRMEYQHQYKCVSFVPPQPGRALPWRSVFWGLSPRRCPCSASSASRMNLSSFPGRLGKELFRWRRRTSSMETGCRSQASLPRIRLETGCS